MPEVGFTVPRAEIKARLAINLADTDRMLPAVRDKALRGKLKSSLGDVVRMDKNAADGEPAAEFCCGLLTAAVTCDIIRGHDRAAGDAPTGVYLFKESWQKLAGDAVLTVVVDGKVALNPALFPEAKLPVRAAPLPVRRMV